MVCLKINVTPSNLLKYHRFFGYWWNKIVGCLYMSHASSEPIENRISQKSIKLLSLLGARKCVAGVVFNTTASNAGDKTGACASYQKELGKRLF